MFRQLMHIVILSGGMFHCTARQDDKYHDSLDPKCGKPINIDDTGKFIVNLVAIFAMRSIMEMNVCPECVRAMGKISMCSTIT